MYIISGGGGGEGNARWVGGIFRREGGQRRSVGLLVMHICTVYRYTDVSLRYTDARYTGIPMHGYWQTCTVGDTHGTMHAFRVDTSDVVVALIPTGLLCFFQLFWREVGGEGVVLIVVFLSV